MPSPPYESDFLPDDGEDGVGKGAAVAGPTWAQHVPEPYYSNQDIAILHAIVTTAQEHVDASSPKPLPAAALFKAYDEVLPRYGIDPDSEHHLSTLVFRIGGEQGSQSLIDKFQTTLGRMGIVLEFGDNTTTSLRTSWSEPSTHSDQIYVQDSPKRDVGASDKKAGGLDDTVHSLRNAPLMKTSIARVSSDDEHHIDETTQSSLPRGISGPLMRYSSATDQQAQKPNDGDGVTIDGSPQRKMQQPLLVRGNRNASSLSAWHPPLLSAMERWRDAVARTHENRSSNKRVVVEHVEQGELGVEDKSGFPVKNLESNVPSPSAALDVGSRPPMPIIEKRATILATGQDTHAGEHPEQPDFVTRSGENPSLKHSPLSFMLDSHRAVRARQIFIASKFLNHWADKTARRLEREAIARRHMVRFRCFRGWCQMPSSRTPLTDQLQVSTAFQKLQRAVREQEEQLQIASSAIAVHISMKSCLRTAEHWLCRCKANTAKENGLRRKLRATLLQWKSAALNNAQLAQELRVRSRQNDRARTLWKWHSRTECEAAQMARGEHIKAACWEVDTLRRWWDVVEVKRRGQSYRHHLLVAKGIGLFEQWNLLVRAQAFKWKAEFITANKVFDLWKSASDAHNIQDLQARELHKERSQRRVLRALGLGKENSSELRHLQDRASFFIHATRVLAIFDRNVKVRKAREREAVRLYLRSKYTQISSTRKRRNFFNTLEKWQISSSTNTDMVDVAKRLLLGHTRQQQMLMVDHWLQCGTNSQRLEFDLEVYQATRWLSTWSSLSTHHRNVYSQAISASAATQQSDCLKGWSIAALQQSGQAHTAATLSQRRKRGLLRKAAHFWKDTVTRDQRYAQHEYQQATLEGFPTTHLSDSWRPLSVRRSFIRRLQHPQDTTTGVTDTPMRRTQTPLPMSALFSRSHIPSIREDSDEDLAIIVDQKQDALESPLVRRQYGPTALHTQVSTTPRGPVPIHMAKNFPLLTSSSLPGNVHVAQGEDEDQDRGVLDLIQENEASLHDSLHARIDRPDSDLTKGQAKAVKDSSLKPVSVPASEHQQNLDERIITNSPRGLSSKPHHFPRRSIGGPFASSAKTPRGSAGGRVFQLSRNRTHLFSQSQ